MANTYLTKTYSTQPTNGKIGTFSFWIKFSGLSAGGDKYIFSTYENNNNRTLCKFNTSGQFEFQTTEGANAGLRYDTNRLFRDTNAWYNIIIATDTTQSTAANRVKIYVNGVQETSFATANNPAQNLVPHFLYGGIQKWIGVYGASGGTNWDGLMSHVSYIDGTQELPTIFGETDSTTGEWKIKTNIVPSSGWGTNGYWILKDGNTGTDSSSNSNNWTVGGGTGIISKTEDCPSNVFNTFNPLDDYYEAGTFFNGNTTYQTGTASNKYGRNTSTLGMTSGKFYWEVKPVSVNTSIDYYPVIGITASQITGSQDYVGKAATDYSWSTNQDGSSTVKYNNNNDTAWGNHFALNSIVGVAVDLDNNKIYFSKDGVWQESGDPTSGSTGTGAAFTITSASSTPLGAYFPSLSNYDGTGYVKFEANFGNGYFGSTQISSAGTNASGIGIFEYAVPTGYTALSTKGLNL